MRGSAKPSLWLSLILTGTLLLGVVGGVYLVNHPQIFKSKASENGSVIILDTNGQQLENNTTTTPNIKLNIELPDWNSNPSQSFNLNFSLVKEAKAWHGNCLDTQNDCVYWEGYYCDENTHECTLPNQSPPSTDNVCQYREDTSSELCQYGGRNICQGSDEGAGCHYNQAVDPACKSFCKCQYEEEPQNCPNGGKRLCWGEEELNSGIGCGYDSSGGVDPSCVETCNEVSEIAPDAAPMPAGDDVGLSAPDLPEVTDRVRVSLDSSSVQPNGICQNSSDPNFNGNPSSHCLEMTYPELLSKLNSGGLDWSFGGPGVYTIYAGFISNKNNFRLASSEITYQPIQDTAMADSATAAPQVPYKCACLAGEGICNSGCSSNGTVGNYCSEDSSCTTKVESSLPQFAYPGKDPQQLFRDSGLSLEDYQKILTDLQAVYGDKVIGWVWQDLGNGEKRPSPIYKDTDTPGGVDLSLQEAVDAAGYVQAGVGITGAVVGNSAIKILQNFGHVLKTLTTNPVNAVFYAGSYMFLNPDDSGESTLTISQAETLLGEKIELLYINYGEAGLIPRGVIKTESLSKKLEKLGGLDIEYFPDKDAETGEERVVIIPKSEVSVYQRALEVFLYALFSEGGGRVIIGGGSRILSSVSGPVRNLYTRVVGSNIPDGVLTAEVREGVEAAEREFSAQGRSFNQAVDRYMASLAQPAEKQAVEVIIAKGLDQPGSLSSLLQGKNNLEEIIGVVNDLGYIPQEGAVVSSEAARRQIQEAIAFSDFKSIGNLELRQSVVAASILEEEKSLLLSQTPKELIENLRKRYKFIEPDGSFSAINPLLYEDEFELVSDFVSHQYINPEIKNTRAGQIMQRFIDEHPGLNTLPQYHLTDITTGDELLAAARSGHLINPEGKLIPHDNELEGKISRILRREDSPSELPYDQYLRTKVVQLRDPSAARSIASTDGLPRLTSLLDNTANRTTTVISGRTTSTEGEAIQDMMRFLDELEIAGSPGLKAEVKAFRDNMVFIGEPELQSAIDTMAQRLERVIVDEDRFVIVLRKDTSMAARRESVDQSSDTYITTRVMERFSELTNGVYDIKNRVLVAQDIDQVIELAKQVGQDRVKIMSFDDVSLGGLQLSSLVGYEWSPVGTDLAIGSSATPSSASVLGRLVSEAGFTKEQAKNSIEANLIAIAQDHEIKNVLNVNAVYNIPRYQVPSDVGFAQTISVSTVTSSSDAGWEYVIDHFVTKYYGETGQRIKDFPLLYKFQRPYKVGHPEYYDFTQRWERVKSAWGHPDTSKIRQVTASATDATLTPLEGALTAGRKRLVSELTPEQRLETRAILRQKYDLPPFELSNADPAEYIRRLLQIADDNGIDVRNSGEYGTRLFQETAAKQGVYQTDFVQIVLNNPSGNISDSIQILEHEVIHGLQFKRYPRMPIDEKEFESFLASSAPGDILSSPGRIDDLIENSLKINETLDNAVAGGVLPDMASQLKYQQFAIGKLNTIEDLRNYFRTKGYLIGKNGEYIDLNTLDIAFDKALYEADYTQLQEYSFILAGKVSQLVNVPFSNATNFQGLFVIITQKGGVQESQQYYTANELKSLVNQVRSGSQSLDVIPSAEGLRVKVEALLRQEGKPVAYSRQSAYIPPGTIFPTNSDGIALIPQNSFEVISVLGSGMSGSAKLVRVQGLERPLVLKTVGASVKARTEVANEITALTLLKKEGIDTVPKIEGLLSGSDTNVFMEYIQGETIDQLANKVPAFPFNGVTKADKSSSEMIEMLTQLLQTLAKVHKTGMIHNDLANKPVHLIWTSVLLPDGTIRQQLKLIDFGIVVFPGSVTNVSPRTYIHDVQEAFGVILKYGYHLGENFGGKFDVPIKEGGEASIVEWERKIQATGNQGLINIVAKIKNSIYRDAQDFAADMIPILEQMRP